MTREQNNNYQYTIQYKEKNKPLDTGTPNILGSLGYVHQNCHAVNFYSK